jgi:hypothetical protein
MQRRLRSVHSQNRKLIHDRKLRPIWTDAVDNVHTMLSRKR